jgi:uncharacterized protein (DUF885 family)
MRTPAALTALALVLAACATAPTPPRQPSLMDPSVPTVGAGTSLSTTAEDQRLSAFLDKAFDEALADSPQGLTSLGIKQRYGELNDYTRAQDERSLARSQRQLAEMRREFNTARLSPAARVSYRLFEEQVQRATDNARWRDYGFLFTANGSPAGSLPVFLINSHRVDTVADAEAYVSRLREMERVGNEIGTDFEARAAKGITPPAFVFDPATSDARKVLAGAPFTAGADTPVWADFKTKVGKLQAPDEVKARLLSEGQAALTGPFRRGIERMVASLERVRPQATSNAGVWRLPNGDAYYADRVRASTTTNLTPDQIHQIGLAQSARLQAEMEQIKQQVGFQGTLQQFFKHLKDDPRFEYPNTAAGREQYLSDARGFIAQVMAKAPQYFHRLPKGPLEVRAVEPWREATASVAFYSRGTPDGSRPGIYYVNLSDMTQVLKPQIEGISYHEGAPGHHFQIAFAQEQGDLPKFRRFGGYGAYSEGWGLYSERLGKEMGFYQDPYSDFGRLSLELWRAARLVTDTGLHAKRWTREQAMDYFRQNTLLSDLDIQREVDRYITNPGQATSYMIGQLRILELREKARRELGGDFDIRDFHAAVLDNGSLPLDVLSEQVDAYIARKKGR